MSITQTNSIVRQELSKILGDEENWFHHKNDKLCIVFEECGHWKEIADDMGYDTEITLSDDLIVYHRIYYEWYALGDDI